MAKIDVTKIDNYDGLSAETKAYLEGIDIPDLNGYIKKDTFDKTASELAELKKKQREMLSEEEQKRLAQEEEMKALRSQVEEMTKREKVSSIENQYLALGFDSELAKSTAEASVNADFSAVSSNIAKFVEKHDKETEARLLAGIPKGDPKGKEPGSDVMTLDKLRKMSADDRHKYSVEHPEEYKQLYTN